MRHAGPPVRPVPRDTWWKQGRGSRRDVTLLGPTAWVSDGRVVKGTVKRCLAFEILALLVS